MELLGESEVEADESVVSATKTWGDLWRLETDLLHLSPTRRAFISKRIERGRFGDLLKIANGHKCQLCEALGMSAHTFKKTNGTWYVEAHHIVPVSKGVVGSLGFANIITVCANHHRELHYGNVPWRDRGSAFEFTLNDRKISVAKFAPPTP